MHCKHWVVGALSVTVIVFCFAPSAFANLPTGATYYSWNSPNSPTPMFDYSAGYCFLTSITYEEVPPTTAASAYLQGAQNPNPPYELRWELTGNPNGGKVSLEALCIPWTTLNPGGGQQEGQFSFGTWYGGNSTDYALGNGEMCSMGGMQAVYENGGGAPIYELLLPQSTAGNCGTVCDYGLVVQNGYFPDDTIDVNCVRPYGTSERFGNVSPGGNANPVTTLFSYGAFGSGGTPPLAASSICALQIVYPNDDAQSFSIQIQQSENGVSGTWQLNTTNASGEMDCVYLPMH